MQVPQEIKERVGDKLVECLAIAEKHFDTGFQMPVILYKKRGRTAGSARVRPDEYYVDFNAVLLMENTDAFIAQTVPHELAHVIEYQLYGDTGHSPRWKNIMRLLGAEPRRYHNYDVSNSQVRTTSTYRWVCQDCGAVIGTKKERAQLIYDTMMDNGASRKDIIERFMMDLNMSKAGASTYYYNCKK